MTWEEISKELFEEKTGKRFVDYFDKDHNYIIQDLQNEDEYQVGFVNCDEDVFLELINQLSDESEQLKTTIQQLRTDNTKQKKKLNTTMKENEQLKHQLQQQELEYATTYHRLAEENESFKEENKFLRNKVATYKSGNALLKKSMDKEWK